jgi:hypothetical protein
MTARFPLGIILLSPQGTLDDDDDSSNSFTLH